MTSWFGWGGSNGSAQDLQPLGTAPMSHSNPGSGRLSGSATGPYQVGELVEYFSASQKTWILAKVLEVNPKGTYNLDCKPEVTPDKIRRPQGGSSGIAATGTDAVPFSAGTYSVGEMVEYFSASQGKWIPAKVLQANPKGTYNLDCKPEVSTDKIRKMAPTQAAKLETSIGSTNGLREASQMNSTGGTGIGSFFSSFMAPSSTSKLPPASVGIQDAPVQLLRVRKNGGRWFYEVCDEGARLLERYGSRRIAVVSVCGLYRTGKSYLLNLLLERVQRGQSLFQVGSTSRACTEGLWLWGSLDSDDERTPLLAFLDCEGFGSTESDKSRDAQLMTLCALLSSVLMLNTKGALNESLFNGLSLVCKFAEHIEERGNEASRPALMWVLRDFMLELRDANGRPTSPDEYLEQALSSAPTHGDQSRGQGAREVRQSLLKFFSQRSCATLVQPAVEERQLQTLASMPYSSLRGEFRAGVEALRTQVLTTSQANPKTVSGHPLGCFGFVALLRQLVQAMNQQKALSVKGAWETVQHTACGSLSDELRNQACATLRTLAGGQPLAGGAALPLTDEALRMVLRQQRHELKSQWEERAVGDEVVRKEYWQELKVSLEREEAVVKQQNARVADQKLVEALNRWQAWLDDDNGNWSTGERTAKDLGSLMDVMPSAPLSRTARAAIEAAGRRVAAARSAISATTEQSEMDKRQAIEFGEKATQQHGTARTELEAKKREILEHQENLKEARQNHQRTQMEAEALQAELAASKDQLQKLLQQIDESRDREHEHKTKHVDMMNKETALRADFDNIQQAYAKAQADHMTAERLAQAAADAHEAEKRRMENEVQAEKRRIEAEKESERRLLEAEINQLRAQVNEKGYLEKELEQTRGKANEHGRLSTDVDRLRNELEQTRNNHSFEVSEKSRIVADKARIEAELEHHRNMQSAEKSRLEGELERLREQIKEKSRIEAELHESKLQVSEKTRLQYDLDHHKNISAEKEKRYESEMDKLKSEAQRIPTIEAELQRETFEKRKLQSELEFAKKQADDLNTLLSQERTQLKGEHERTRQEYEATRQRLEEERKAHASAIDGETKRSLDNERNTGMLQGKVQTIEMEAQTLRDRMTELQRQAVQKTSENEQLKHDLEKERIEKEAAEKEKVQTAEKLKQQEDEYEEKMKAGLKDEKGQQKKCCVVM